MSSPLIFFVIIVVIDLILKSMKDKKKAEQSRNRDGRQRDMQNKTQTMQKEVTTQSTMPKRSNTIRDLRKALEDEFENQKSKYENIESGRNQTQPPKVDTVPSIPKASSRMERIEKQREKISKHSELGNLQRLEREESLSMTRLSKNQVTLGQLSGRSDSLFDDSENTRNQKMEVKNIGREDAKSTSYKRGTLKQDLLTGIIFSEILNEPKSIAKKRI